MERYNEYELMIGKADVINFAKWDAIAQEITYPDDKDNLVRIPTSGDNVEDLIEDAKMLSKQFQAPIYIKPDCGFERSAEIEVIVLLDRVFEVVNAPELEPR